MISRIPPRPETFVLRSRQLDSYVARLHQNHRFDSHRSCKTDSVKLRDNVTSTVSGKGGNTHCGVRRRQKKEKKYIIIFSNRIRRFHPGPRECSQWHRGNDGKEESKLWTRFDTVPSSAGHVLLFSDMICQSERLLDGLCPKPDREEAIRRPFGCFCTRSYVHV